MHKLVLAATISVSLALLGGCASRGEATSDKAELAVDERALDAVLAGTWRDPKNVARDPFRNPKPTLGFFGVKPTDTVVEIQPGAGWYTEILAPYLRERGRYVAGMLDHRSFASERAQKFYEKANNDLKARAAANPAVFGTPAFIEADQLAPSFGEDGSADVVLTFRNVHNWVGAGSQEAMFQAFFEVLKPGGVLGVVEHRAAPGKSLEEVKASGYMPEEYVVALAIKAGFVLDARSEINANPKDTKDHEGGVWALPPSYRNGDKDRAKYQAIGESDRMTLRFVKPRG